MRKHIAEPAKEVHPVKPCSDCVNGKCDMNCGPVISETDAAFDSIRASRKIARGISELAQPTPSQGCGDRELPPLPASVIEAMRDAHKYCNGELEGCRLALAGREDQLKATLAEIQQLKEVQPSVQFEEWWNPQYEETALATQSIPESWNPLMNAQSAPVDWEKVVREKFPNADSRDGAIWKSEGSFTILGYSWQHAAHHPDVIGQDKWEGEDGKRG